MGNPTIVDQFDGWMVLNVDVLKDARAGLPKDKQSLKYISQCTDIPVAQLSVYFSGKRFPSLKNFKKLCLFLQILPNDALGVDWDLDTEI